VGDRAGVSPYRGLIIDADYGAYRAVRELAAVADHRRRAALCAMRLSPSAARRPAAACAARSGHRRRRLGPRTRAIRDADGGPARRYDDLAVLTAATLAFALGVEGTLDAIAVTAAGVGRYAGVALCGTALTAAQVTALDTHAGPLAERRVVAAFDNDTGGRQAALRAYQLLAATGAWPTTVMALTETAQSCSPELLTLS